jgi:hypothetical protein
VKTSVLRRELAYTQRQREILKGASAICSEQPGPLGDGIMDREVGAQAVAVLDLRWPYCDLLLLAYFRNAVAEISLSPEDDETSPSQLKHSRSRF